MMLKFLEDPITFLLSHSDQWKSQKLQIGEVTVTTKQLGILEVSPKQPTHHVLAVSCGIHGNETAPIEIVADLLKEIANGTLVPRLKILIQFGNLEGMKEQSRFLDFNLNRLFCDTYKEHPKALESERAKLLQDTLESFFETSNKELSTFWHFDLHTAIRGSFHQKFAIRPFCDRTDYPEITAAEISVLKSLDLEVVVQSDSKNSTYSSYSANKHSAISFTMELGKVKPFGENNRSDFQGTYVGLRSFMELGSPSPQGPSQKDLIHYKVVEELIRHNESTELHLHDNYENFTPIEAKAPIQTTDGETRFARDGESVIFPNKNVKLGQRTGLIISPFGKL